MPSHALSCSVSCTGHQQIKEGKKEAALCKTSQLEAELLKGLSQRDSLCGHKRDCSNQQYQLSCRKSRSASSSKRTQPCLLSLAHCQYTLWQDCIQQARASLSIVQIGSTAADPWRLHANCEAAEILPPARSHFWLFLTRFFGFRFDPYTKLARVAGMATTQAASEVCLGDFFWFSAHWSSALDRSLSL